MARLKERDVSTMPLDLGPEQRANQRPLMRVQVALGEEEQ